MRASIRNMMVVKKSIQYRDFCNLLLGSTRGFERASYIEDKRMIMMIALSKFLLVILAKRYALSSLLLGK